MKNLLLCILVILAGISAIRAESVTPAPVLASGDSLMLTDGRTFTDWSIRRQTPEAVFIASKGGIGKIDKRLLPESMHAQFPYDGEAAAKEQAAFDAADRAANARAKAKHDAMVADAEASMRANQKYIDAKNKEMANMIQAAKDRDARAATVKAMHEADLAKSFDGLIIENVSSVHAGLLVAIRNAHENPRIVHKGDFTVTSSKGDTVDLGDIHTMGQETSFLLSGGERRSFLLVTTNPDCAQMRWTDRADLPVISIQAQTIAHRHANR